MEKKTKIQPLDPLAGQEDDSLHRVQPLPAYTISIETLNLSLYITNTAALLSENYEADLKL